MNERIESLGRENAGLKRAQEIRETSGYVRVDGLEELRRSFEQLRQTSETRQEAQSRTPLSANRTREEPDSDVLRGSQGFAHLYKPFLFMDCNAASRTSVNLRSPSPNESTEQS